MLDIFQKDDEGYIAWLTAHPSGFVVNIDDHSVKLHRASCKTLLHKVRPEFHFTHAHLKICCTNKFDARDWAVGARTTLQKARCCNP